MGMYNLKKVQLVNLIIMVLLISACNSSVKVSSDSENKLFSLNAGLVEKGGVDVNVFEASSHYEVILNGLDEQMVINLIAAKEQIERYPGLKVGSMTEASTDGNWE